LPASSSWDGEGFPPGIMAVSAESVASAGRFGAAGLVAGRFVYANRQVRNVDFASRWFRPSGRLW